MIYESRCLLWRSLVILKKFVNPMGFIKLISPKPPVIVQEQSAGLNEVTRHHPLNLCSGLRRILICWLRMCLSWKSTDITVLFHFERIKRTLIYSLCPQNHIFFITAYITDYKFLFIKSSTIFSKLCSFSFFLTCFSCFSTCSFSFVAIFSIFSTSANSG